MEVPDKTGVEISGIEAVRTADYMTANNVVLVQMSSDVVRVVEAMPLTTVEWGTEGGLIHNFKVMTIMVPQIRADQNGASGITHLRAAV